MTVYFVPDTNFFLQCFKPESLDWRLVTTETSVVLLVVKEVQREIDRHKSGGNARRAKRAREVAGILREIIRANAKETSVVAGAYKISVRLAPRLPKDREKPEELDLTAADERIVEEAFACSRLLGTDLALLTDDMAPFQAAREVGIGAVSIPDTWLLPPELSDMEKQLRSVQKQVEHLMGSGPLIKVEAIYLGSVVARLDGTLTRYRELSSEFVARAVSAIRLAHPLDGTKEHAYVSIFGAEKYRNDYQRWESDLQQRIEALPRYFNALTSPASLSVKLINEGVSSADHVVVDIFARGNIYLADQSLLHRIEKSITPMLQPPPEFENIAPFSRTLEARKLGDQPAFPSIRPIPNREFRWTSGEGDALSQHMVGECIDFRHALDPIVKELHIRAAPESNEELSGVLEIRVSARNVAIPVEATIPVRLRPSLQDSEQRASEVILQELGVQL